MLISDKDDQKSPNRAPFEREYFGVAQIPADFLKNTSYPSLQDLNQKWGVSLAKA